MTDITLYHNPQCSKSRQTLQLLEDQGLTPEIVLYLDAPPDEAILANIAELLDLKIHDLLRTGEEAYQSEMAHWSDSQLCAAVQEFPILLQRPIVVTNTKARIGRPPEAVLEIL